MSLEAVLADLEGADRRFPRDPDLYYVTLFSTPSGSSPLGWRVEGHHLSLNFLIVGANRIAPTPCFLGTNPAEVRHGPMEGLRVLAAEEDLARRLLLSLDQSQVSRALIDVEAPADIVTRAEPRVKLDDPVGIAASELTQAQPQILMDLILEYVSRIPRDVADARMNQIEREDGSHIHFAWAGSRERGQPHYYRVHGPSFLIEYDNTQNSANHIHSVWRDIQDDWGEDLLRSHYTRSH
jgi:hypothetical protein